MQKVTEGQRAAVDSAYENALRHPVEDRETQIERTANLNQQNYSGIRACAKVRDRLLRQERTTTPSAVINKALELISSLVFIKSFLRFQARKFGLADFPS